MNTSRRDFLRRAIAGGVGLATVGAEFDLERLLWVPKPMVTVPAMPLAFHPLVYSMTVDFSDFDWEAAYKACFPQPMPIRDAVMSCRVVG